MMNLKTALIAATENGWRTAERIAANLPGAYLQPCPQGIRKGIEAAWHSADGIVCVMAAGIVVRCLAGLCISKYRDPCVIVVDESGRHAISLLSGHIGGGNRLAEEVAGISGGTAVITTGSDVSGHTAVDLWTIEQNLSIGNPELLARISALLINSGALKVFQDGGFVERLPDDFKPCTNRAEADIVISLSDEHGDDQLRLTPRIRYIGLGCRRGTTVDEFEQALEELEKHHAVDLHSIAGLASVDIKKDEAGLLEIGRKYNWPIRFFTKEQLAAVAVPSRSSKVYDKIGIYGVCESAAVLAASTPGTTGRLIIQKVKWERITAAVAQREF